jgi:hypothetical protein
MRQAGNTSICASLSIVMPAQATRKRASNHHCRSDASVAGDLGSSACADDDNRERGPNTCTDEARRIAVNIARLLELLMK